MSLAPAVAGYSLLRVLGQGGHAVVHLARHEATGMLVALKLLELGSGIESGPESGRTAESFLAAARASQRLLHPGIVGVHGFGLAPAQAWLAMELVAGTDLSRYTQPARLLPEALSVQIAARVAAALGYAHRQGVVHRDVKPANILVDWPSNAVKLADFGLARAADGMQTATGIVPGSPAYMAPEQLAGNAPTPRSDLYALGVTLFQLLTARLPHEGASMGELLRRVAEEPAPDLRTLRPDLPADLAGVLARLLAKNAADRPADADEAARLLTAVAGSLQGPT